MSDKIETKNFGTVYTRPDGSYVVDNYHVLPKDQDPYGKYDFDEVAQYAKANPDKVKPEPQPEPPTPAELKARRTAEIKARLTDIDFKTARAGRRVAIGVASDEDLTYLRIFESEAEALREELRTL